MSEFLLGWEHACSHRRIGFVQNNVDDDLLGSAAKIVSDASDSHILVIAPTGAGKGRNIIIPNLLHYDGPVIVVDIKGEAAAVTAAWRRDVLGHQVAVIDPWQRSGLPTAGFNPIDYLARDPDNLGDNAYSMAAMISGRHAHSAEDPFWDERAEALVAGMLADFAASPDIKDRSMGALWAMANSGDLNWLLADRAGAEGLHPFARSQYEGFFGISADNTRAGIQAVALSHIRNFGGKAVQRATATTDFRLDDVIEGRPLTIYLVVPPSRLVSHGGLLRMWLAALVGLVTERRERPEKPTLLVVDEWAHIGPLEPVKHAVTLARGYGLRCALFLQSHAQLRHLFPKDHETVLENCGVVATFGHASMSMSRQMGDALGDIGAEALWRMGRDRLAARHGGRETRLVRRLDYLADDLFAGRFDPNPMFGPGDRRAA